jgi:hypothetical protein
MSGEGAEYLSLLVLPISLNILCRFWKRQINFLKIKCLVILGRRIDCHSLHKRIALALSHLINYKWAGLIVRTLSCSVFHRNQISETCDLQ